MRNLEPISAIRPNRNQEGRALDLIRHLLSSVSHLPSPVSFLLIGTPTCILLIDLFHHLRKQPG